MRPTPDERQTDRLQQSLDAWGRAAGHATQSMPPTLSVAVAARRHTRRAQQGAGAVAAIALVVGALAWLAPTTAPLEPGGDDLSDATGPVSARLIDLRRANSAMDLDALRLPEAPLGGTDGPAALREALGLRPYEPVEHDAGQTIEPRTESSNPPSR